MTLRIARCLPPVMARGAVAGLAWLALLSVSAPAAVLYQDSCEGGDIASRYTMITAGVWGPGSGAMAYVAAPGGGHAIRPTSGNTPIVMQSTSYAGGHFTNTHLKATFDLYNNGYQGQHAMITLLAQSWYWPHVGGYNFFVFPWGAQAVGIIERNNMDGTMTPIASAPWDGSVPAMRSGYWETVTAEVEVKAASTDLKLVWKGLATDGVTPITYTWTGSDTSAGRYTGGTGFALKGYNGDSNGGVYLDNLVIAKVSEPGAVADDVAYGVGSWPEGGRGNHRAVVRVEAIADAVVVTIPWRRRDREPEQKAVIIYDSTTGQRVTNAVPVRMDRFSGDIVFQPPTVPGNYEVYYMPYEPQVWQPGVGAQQYLPPTPTADPGWLAAHGLPPADAGVLDYLPRGEVLRIEARSDFDRMDPMEVVATPGEVAALVAAHADQPYLVFPENRMFPVRMKDDLPLKWIKSGSTNAFSGAAQPDEYYAFQVAVFAAGAAIGDAAVEFSDLENAGGGRIPASALHCYNLGGTNRIGQSFTSQFQVARGEVGTLWCGVQVPPDASGTYRGTVRITPTGMPQTAVALTIEVSGPALADHGDSETWRHSRLRWLDSTKGLDETVIPPYTPVTVAGSTLGILNRSITFAPGGLPQSMVSNQREILASPIRFSARTAAGEVPWQAGAAITLESTPAKVVRKTLCSGDGLDLAVTSKTEFDGAVTYSVKLTATRDTDLADVSLLLPLRAEVARYMMGMSKVGGFRPQQWDWSWTSNRCDQQLWIGDVNAGVQIMLGDPAILQTAGFVAQWLPKGWYNGGQGGATVRESGDAVDVRAFSGPLALKAGESLDFDFRLLVTPFKPIDRRSWNYRISNSLSSPAGANILHLHHADSANPYINYPFLPRPDWSPIDLAARVREVNNTLIPSSVGRLEYPTQGNLLPARGALHIRAKVNFDPATSGNQGLCSITSAKTYAESEYSFGFYWNVDAKGMRAYLREGQQEVFPYLFDAPQPGWRRGDTHTLTFSWGDALEICVDGQLIARWDNPKVLMDAQLDRGVLTLGGGFGIEAVKISDQPYLAGQPISLAPDANTLFFDDFSACDGITSRPVKAASDTTGQCFGVVEVVRGNGANEVVFSSTPGHYGVNLYYTIRELSNHATELWALRALKEVLNGTAFDQGAVIEQSGGGSAWLQEHLVNGYTPAWQSTLWDTDTDAAVGTYYLSRWNNYYVEGVDWLMKNPGVDGLYLDGIGYDRETMKRVARVMRANNPDYRIVPHGGDSYHWADGKTSMYNLYMEHLPYVTSMWVGEFFNFDRSPDYYLVEISGLPFGVMTEMLEYSSGGNAYRGMVYGMTGRFHPSCGAMWQYWDQFGIQDAEMLGYWNPQCPVKTDNTNVLATVYRKPDRTLIALADWSGQSGNVTLLIDWQSLGINPAKATLLAPEIANFQTAQTFKPTDAIPVSASKGWLLELGGPATTNLLYSNEGEGGDFISRYVNRYGESGSRLLYKPSPTSGSAIGDNAGGVDGLWALSTRYAGGGFTNTHLRATFKEYIGSYGSQIRFTLLRQGDILGDEGPAGYQFLVYPDGAQAVGQIRRTETNGSATILAGGELDGRYPAARLGYWATITADVEVKATSTDLTLTWKGLAQDGLTPIYYTWTCSDTSARRYTSGRGFAMLVHSENGASYLDNITIHANPPLYSDDGEGGDIGFRYTMITAGVWGPGSGAMAYVAAPAGGNAIRPTSGNFPIFMQSTSYAGGRFTNTHLRATFDVFNTDLMGQQAHIVLLAQSWIWPHVGGYDFQVYPYGNKAVGWITRNNLDGSATQILGDLDNGPVALRCNYWETITAEVEVKAASTDLTLVWKGLATDGVTPITYTWTGSDTSAGRYTGGTGFGLCGYNGDVNSGVYLDNLVIETISPAIATPPTLGIGVSNSVVRVYWPAASDPGFILQTNSNLASTNWGNAGTPYLEGSNKVWTNRLTSDRLFFRFTK